MRFNQMVHPELILNKRGEKLSRGLYQAWMKMVTDIDYSDSKKQIAYEFDNTQIRSAYDMKLMNILRDDNMFAQHICLVKKFIKLQGKVFHFTKPLLEDLSKMNKQIPSEFLPDNFIGYLSFPPGAIEDESNSVQGAYVCVCPAVASVSFGPDEPKYPGEEKTDRVIWISYVCEERSQSGMLNLGMSGIGGLLMPFISTRAEDLMGRTMDYSTEYEGSKVRPSQEILDKRSRVYGTIINCMIFLQCKNVQFEISKPIQQLGLSNNAVLRSGGVINQCTLPITFVNRSYHGVQHSKDSTHVRSHLRWQRCGPGNTLIDLVPVKAHERHYVK